jgi:heme-degrading monooxygenase HmoA
MDKMGIEVLIRRKFIAEKAKDVAPLMVQLRSLARSQPGYISSESLKCIEPPEQVEYLIRSTWNSVANWKKWLHSDTRKAIQHQVDTITGVDTEYRIYEPLLDGFFENLNR